MGTATTTPSRPGTLRIYYSCFIRRKRVDGDLRLDGFSAWINRGNNRRNYPVYTVHHFCATTHSFCYLRSHF